ncbi:MAG: hypothetical protein ACYC4B_32975, partial [Pirellulaceae bacterium]
AELIEDNLKERPLVEVYDTLLIPALALAEIDWHNGEIDEGRHDFILQSLREIVREGDEGQAGVPSHEGTEEGTSPKSSILCLPARDEADALAGMMLAQLLNSSGYPVESVSAATTTSELVDIVERSKAVVVCISSTPPAAVTYARHLCRHLRECSPNVHLVVGLWNAASDLSKAKARIGVGDTTHVVATLAEALEQVRLLVPPPEMPPQPESGIGVVEEVPLSN